MRRNREPRVARPVAAYPPIPSACLAASGARRQAGPPPLGDPARLAEAVRADDQVVGAAVELADLRGAHGQSSSHQLFHGS